MRLGHLSRFLVAAPLVEFMEAVAPSEQFAVTGASGGASGLGGPYDEIGRGVFGARVPDAKGVFRQIRMTDSEFTSSKPHLNFEEVKLRSQPGRWDPVTNRHVYLYE